MPGAPAILRARRRPSPCSPTASAITSASKRLFSFLFPEYERRNGTASDSGATAALRTEHRQILALVAAIELTIRTDAVPVHVLRSYLRDVLRDHNRTEEETLYPVTDSVERDGVGP